MSGSNCAIVLLAALGLARRLGLGVRAAPVSAGLALLGFVVLARPSPSVLRAGVMGLVAVLALATGSRRAGVPALSAAVLVLVLVWPALASEPGFALSVTATAGLLVLAPGWRDGLARRMPRRIAEMLVVPAAAQVACAPLVAGIAGQVSLVAIPANLVAVPAVPPATVLGVLAAASAPLIPPLASVCGALAYLPTAWLVRVAHTGAALPNAAVGWPSGAAGGLLLGALTLAALLLLPWRPLRLVAAVVAPALMVGVTAVGLLMPGWPPRGWVLAACDVGQGDALVLSVAAGSAVVVDAGPDPRLVDRCLRDLRVHSVPLVVLTHLHADHLDGLPGLLRGRRVAEIAIGPLDDPEEAARTLESQAAEAGVPVTRSVAGEVRTVGALRWEVVGPERPFRGTDSDPNNSSLVLRVTGAGWTALLTGDIEPPAQRRLLEAGIDLRADVLKVPHHGSDHQEPAFLDAVGARLALASVGAGNRYGHPSPATLGRLAAGGARTYRTDADGTVAVLVRDGALLAVGRTRHGPVASAKADAPAGDRAGWPRGWSDATPPGITGRSAEPRRHLPPVREPAAADPRARSPPHGGSGGRVDVGA